MLAAMESVVQPCLALPLLSLCMKLAGLITLSIALNPETIACLQLLNKLDEGLVGQTQVRRLKKRLMPLLRLQTCVCSLSACIHLEVKACACTPD